jgi:predicted hexulose-6-phosphate isomerase
MNVKPYPFILYEKALAPNDWPKMFEDTAKLGFDGFEISIDESDYRLARLNWSSKECLPVIRAAKDAGVRLQSLCFSGQRRFPMGSADSEVVRRSLSLMEKCIHLCQELGVRILQVAGFDVFYEPSSLSTYRRYIDNLARMTQIAANCGVTLAIEPVEKGVLSVEMALEIIREVHSPFLQVYPDIANMASLGIDYFPQIEAGMDHIVQIHIRDALPDYYYGVEMGAGIIDFIETFQLFDRLNLACPLTLEMWNLENPEYMSVLSHAMTFLQTAIKKAGQARERMV